MTAWLAGLAAAALFGASAPLAKLLVGAIHPLVLSGLLYLGAGVAATLVRPRSPDPIRGRDWKYLLGVIVFGGVIGPALLMFGLSRTAASASSLLLNLETLFTAAIAMLFLGEKIGVRGALALVLTTAGAALVTYETGGATRSLYGPLAIAGACLAWGVDNNLTQKLSARDPLVVVRWKGLCAGATSLAIGLAAGGALPPRREAGAALALGAVGYGLSLVCYLYAMRSLGAARTAMLFATAPFSGALLAIPLLHERPTISLAVAALFLAAGAALLLKREPAASAG